MRLFGNSKHSKHVSGRKYRRETARMEDDRDYDAVDNRKTKKKKSKKKKRKGRRVLVVILFILLALAAVGFAIVKGYIKPPSDIGGILRPGGAGGINGSDSEGEPAGRYEGKYTFLLLGKDKVSGSTDTIMVGTFDAKNYKIEIVSIPRDTVVNVHWSTKKANTLYYSDDPQKTKDGFSDLLGYEIDFYAVVDLEAFVKLVDSIGGVWYDVPDVEGNGQGMNYEDPEQNLYIHLQPGYQLLDGENAIGIVRYRKGYSDQDIGRISSQQNFLKSAAKQIIENKDKLNISEILSIFLNYVETDLNYGECAWFAKELLKMDAENINFHTMPGKYDDYIGGRSYVTIYVDQWLEMINTYLNPFDRDIEEENLNVLTRDPSTGRIYSTSGQYAGDPGWGN